MYPINPAADCFYRLSNLHTDGIGKDIQVLVNRAIEENTSGPREGWKMRPVLEAQ